MAKKVVEKAGSSDLIVVKQLPVIEDQLLAVKESIQKRVDEARSLVCTEETYKKVKDVRSALNKEFAELEAKRKEIKTQILAPYEKFESVYKECAGDYYKQADMELKAKIDEVEAGLKAQKADDLAKFFYEYRESIGIPEDFVRLEDARIKVGLSDSKASLHRQATEFLDRILADRTVIDTLEFRDEVMTEYAGKFDLSAAMLAVDNRHKLLEAERKRREEAQKKAEAAKTVEAEVNEALTAQAEPIPVPVAQPVEVVDNQPVNAGETIYQTTFTVHGTLDELKKLKKFLVEGGYNYEQC